MINHNELTIILPTLNEEKNLIHLIPDIYKSLENIDISFNVLVVDDNSTDNTYVTIQNLSEKYEGLNIHVRKDPKSLPLSILDGIKTANSKYIMWLDADGSMDGASVKKLLEKFTLSKESVVIGSRFTEGGGYKGVKSISNSSFYQSILNVRKSKDSVLGMIVSILFNKVLYYIFNSGIRDITSGFIVLEKEYINEEVFKKADYGEYFIFLVEDLLNKNKNIIEVGYICKTRDHGVSKTASSIFQLLIRGIPYIRATISSRIKK